MERRRRGISERLILGTATKKPKDWKEFLSNDDNKDQLTKQLLKEWQKDEYASDLHNRQIILICDRNAQHLTSEDGITIIALDISLL